jgi:hypothetical protein
MVVSKLTWPVNGRGGIISILGVLQKGPDDPDQQGAKIIIFVS